MTSEHTIEKIIEQYADDTEAYESALTALMDAQPALLAFLTQESTDLLLEEEKDIMWYITVVIVNACQSDGITVTELSDNTLSDYEEANWQLLHDQPKGTFREKLTVFFEDYEQEDLLAFVEDTLELEEDSPITAVGRDVIFISAKAVIDGIFQIN